jgi:hypothetical protein
MHTMHTLNSNAHWCDRSELQRAIKDISMYATTSMLCLGMQKHSVSMTHTARETRWGSSCHSLPPSGASFTWTFQDFSRILKFVFPSFNRSLFHAIQSHMQTYLLHLVEVVGRCEAKYQPTISSKSDKETLSDCQSFQLFSSVSILLLLNTPLTHKF